jgi:DNA-binding transcriptional regulator YiaG
MDRHELKKWREDRALSQSDLADLLAVHWKTVSAWENGRQNLPGFLHLALAEIARQLTQKNLKKIA